jgi:hypothetical protein
MHIARAAQAALALLVLAGGAQAAPFEISADGQEVTDRGTGLVWRRCVEGLQWDGKTCAGQPTRMSFAAARSQAQAMATSTKVAWRVPTRDELLGLLDRKPGTSGTPSNTFPQSPASPFWSSTPYTSDGQRAVYVHMSNASDYNDYRSSLFFVRLVRNP